MNKYWLFLLVAALLNACANLLLKRSSIGTEGLGQYLSVFFLVGIALFGLNVVIYAKALQGIPVAFAYPVLVGLGFILVVFGAHFWFQEQITLQKLVGVSVILAGVVLVAK